MKKIIGLIGLFMVAMAPFCSSAQSPSWVSENKYQVMHDEYIVADTFELVIHEARDGHWAFEWSFSNNKDTLIVLVYTSIYGSIYNLYPWQTDTLYYTATSGSGLLDEVMGKPENYNKFVFITTDSCKIDEANWGFKYESK